MLIWVAGQYLEEKNVESLIIKISGFRVLKLLNLKIFLFWRLFKLFELLKYIYDYLPNWKFFWNFNSFLNRLILKIC